MEKQRAVLLGVGLTSFLLTACSDKGPQRSLSGAEINATVVANFQQRATATPDPEVEVIKAKKIEVAQRFCEVLRCEADVLIANTSVLRAPEFQNLTRERWRVHYPNQPVPDVSRTLDYVFPTNEAIVNYDVLQALRRNPSGSGIRSSEKLTPEQLREAVIEASFRHTFGHQLMAQEAYQFSSPLRYKLPTGEYTFHSMVQFFSLGEDGSGKTVDLTGINETFNERLNMVSTRLSGIPYASVQPYYTQGVTLLEMIDRSSGISDEEFIGYATGNLSLKDYFRRVATAINPAQPDYGSAERALVSIGAYVDYPQGISYDQTATAIRQMFSRN